MNRARVGACGEVRGCVRFLEIFFVMVKPIVLGVIGAVVGYGVWHVYTHSAPDDVIFRMGITLVAGLYLGMLFIMYGLPAISDGITRMVFSDPGGEAETDDPLRDARALMAQGEWEGAVEAYRVAIPKDEDNRLPWVEMAKIKVQHLDDPEGALLILQEALGSKDWPLDDAAFFMFRVSEIHLENRGDRGAAIAVLEQVREVFPESRHSANATHQLRELGAL